MEKKTNEKKSIITTGVALFPAFTACLYAPLSIYAANTSEFWFNLRTIWYVPVLFFVLAFACMIGVGWLLKGRIYNIYIGFLFGIGVCFYAQGNFMGIRPGIMNGNKIEWSEYTSQIAVNTIIWILIIATAVILLVKFDISSKIAMYISLFVTAIQAVSLVVILVPVIANGGASKALLPAFTTKDLYEVGSEENIVVFVMDTYDQVYFEKAVSESPEILSGLNGFTYYENFTSVYPTTSYSLTGIMSGKIFRNEMPRPVWVENNAKNTLYFDELIKNGYDISLYTDAMDTIPQRIKDITINYDEIPMHFYNMRTCFSILYRIAGCQYYPDVIKPYIWMDGTEIGATAFTDTEYELFRDNNGRFKDGLDQNGITVRAGAKEYKFIHLYGMHEPYYIDEWGDEASQSWEYVDAAKGCLRIVQDYTSKLKELGVYDKTTIIIMADHGTEGFPGVLCNPIFMMKEKDAPDTPMVRCNYEAGLENYGATIADLAGAENVSSYGLSILDANKNTSFDRYYYQYVYVEDSGNRPKGKNGNYYLVEYLTPRDSNDTTRFELTDVEYTDDGQKISHAQYCEGCQLSGGIPEDYYEWKCANHYHVKDFPY